MNDCIPIILCVDAEPDSPAPALDPSADWIGYERIHALMQRWRAPLAAATGRPVRYCWFLRFDPEVERIYGTMLWARERYDRLIASSLRHGDHFGLHVHSSRWSDACGSFIEDFTDQPWIEHCVRSGFDAFARAMGTPCRSFRFGDHWMNQATFTLIESLGTRWDLTLEPGNAAVHELPMGRVIKGHIPDYHGLPRIPYRPLPDDFTEPDVGREAGTWIIPVTMLPPEGEMSAGPPLHRALPSGGKPYARLGIGFEPQRFRRLFDATLAEFERPLPVPTVRSHAGASVRQHAFLDANFRMLCEHPRAKQFALVAPEEALVAVGLDSSRLTQVPSQSTLP
jgi:hypothetical protein